MFQTDMNLIKINSIRSIRMLLMYFYFGIIALLFDIQHSFRKYVSLTFMKLKLPNLKFRAPNLLANITILNTSARYLTVTKNLLSATLSELHQYLIELCWSTLLHDVHKNGFAVINVLELKCLLYFRPNIIDKPILVDGKAFRLLDIVLCGTPLRFDAAALLIKSGANFDTCPEFEFIFKTADFIFKDVYSGICEMNERGKFYYANAIYFIAEAYRNLLLDKKNLKSHEITKRHFKEIIDYICSLEKPLHASKANFRMANGVPLIAYMPTQEWVDYLLAKGADPNLLNEKFEHLNVTETLLCLEEFERLNIFLEKGYQIRDLFNLVAKQRSLNLTGYCLLHPKLGAQLSDVEKAKLLAASIYGSIRDFGNNFTGNQFRSRYKTSEYKLANFERPYLQLGTLLKPTILELAKQSKEAFKVLKNRRVLFLVARTSGFDKISNEIFKECKKIEDFWVQQDNNILEEISELECWECLPEGIAPRFDIKSLDESRNDAEQLQYTARKILGVPEDGSRAAIIHAYRNLALKYHPDKNPSSQASVEMSCITKARDILLR